jgi:hypothetical protein
VLIHAIPAKKADKSARGFFFFFFVFYDKR